MKEGDDDGEGNSPSGGAVSSGKAGGQDIVWHELDVSAQQLKSWKASADSLKEIRQAVESCDAEYCIFFSHKGLLYQWWIPPGRDRGGE